MTVRRFTKMVMVAKTHMEPMRGFEPRTYALQMRCSTG